MSRKLFVFAMSAALVAISLTALAAPGVDTLLVQGYDSEEMSLIYGVSPQDGNGPDCTLATDEYDYILEALGADTSTSPDATGDDGDDNDDTDKTDKFTVTPVEVKELTQDGDPVQFELEEAANGASDEDTTTTTLSYEEAVECALTALKFEGEVNHGRIVSSFVHAIKDLGRGNGCLVRAISGTDYGKTLKTEDVDGEPASAETVDEASASDALTVTLSTVLCEAKGKDAKTAEDHEPAKADKGAKGKDKAPGQNKTEVGAKGNGKGKNTSADNTAD